MFGSGNTKKEEAAKSKAKAADAEGQKKSAPQSNAEIGEPSIGTAPAETGSAKQASGNGQVASTTIAGPPPEEIFVDGISSLFFRAGIVKFDCYRVVGHDQTENKEARMVSHRLVMPAGSLQGLIKLLQNAANMQRSQAEKSK